MFLAMKVVAELFYKAFRVQATPTALVLSIHNGQYNTRIIILKQGSELIRL